MASLRGSVGGTVQEQPELSLTDGYTAFARPALGVFPVVVPPCVLVQIRLEPLRGDRMVDAPNPALEQGEEPLDGLRVGVALNVDAGRVVDPPMRVTPLAHALVDGGLVGEDHRTREDVFRDVRINLECGGSAD